MKCKNHNLIPTDELWRPSIHDHQPVIQRRKRRVRKKETQSKNSLAKRARYLSGIKGMSPTQTVKMCCKSMDVPFDKDYDYQISVLQSYIVSRGGKVRQSDDFYRSRQWLELRYKTIKKHGRTCMACGATDQPIHVDHIKPRSRFPHLELDEDNLQILCRDCNIGKSNKDKTDWR